MNDRPIIVTDPESTAVERANRRAKSQPKIGSSVGMTLLLIIALAACAVLGWFTWSINSVLGETSESLATALERVQALEQRVTETEGSVSESGQTTQKSISYWETEVRKVWDIANKRNKGWIEENRADIAAMDKRFDDIAGSITDLDNSIVLLTNQQRDLTQQVSEFNQKWTTSMDLLEPRVRMNEQAISAADTSRISTNNRLRSIEQRIRTLENPN